MVGFDHSKSKQNAYRNHSLLSRKRILLSALKSSIIAPNTVRLTPTVGLHHYSKMVHKKEYSMDIPAPFWYKKSSTPTIEILFKNNNYIGLWRLRDLK